MAAISGAYLAWADEHPGRYAAAVCVPGSAVHGIVLTALAGYRLDGGDAIDAARALRAALHGFASPGPGLQADTGRSFDRLVDALAQAFSTWPPDTAGVPS